MATVDYENSRNLRALYPLYDSAWGDCMRVMRFLFDSGLIDEVSVEHVKLTFVIILKDITKDSIDLTGFNFSRVLTFLSNTYIFFDYD